MATIKELPLLEKLSSGDQLAFYNGQNGDTRRAALSAVLKYFQDNFNSPTFTTTVYTPASGNFITVPDSPKSNNWLLLDPATSISNLTITLPLNTTTPDGNQVLVTTTEQINPLTLAANGAVALYGNPSSLAAGGRFMMRYHKGTDSWYMVI